jgi:hypothetical protein
MAIGMSTEVELLTAEIAEKCRRGRREVRAEAGAIEVLTSPIHTSPPRTYQSVRNALM